MAFVTAQRPALARPVYVLSTNKSYGIILRRPFSIEAPTSPIHWNSLGLIGRFSPAQQRLQGNGRCTKYLARFLLTISVLHRAFSISRAVSRADAENSAYEPRRDTQIIPFFYTNDHSVPGTLRGRIVVITPMQNAAVAAELKCHFVGERTPSKPTGEIKRAAHGKSNLTKRVERRRYYRQATCASDDIPNLIRAPT